VVKGFPPKWGTCIRTVPFGCSAMAHVCWKNLIAVGLDSGDIFILNAITGVSISFLSGHVRHVYCLAFTSDGTLLASGGLDQTVKLWDVQTGGVIKTFHGHTGSILSISISQDHTMIASGSGSGDKTIRLWNAQTGECCCIIDGHDIVDSVSFSPTNSQILMSASRDNTIRQWDINGHQIGSTYEGNYVAFSPDGTHFVIGGESVITIQNSDSKVVVCELIGDSGSFGDFNYCCFSPDNKFVAGASGQNLYVWNITKSDPHPIKIFFGHADCITSLTFSSSLISSSQDGSIKFWHIPSLMNPAAVDLETQLLTPAPVVFVTLQVNDGISIAVDAAGVVKAWDILTDHCKASFHCEAHFCRNRDAFTSSEAHVGDVQLIDGRFVLVWYLYPDRTEDEYGFRIYILDTSQGEPQKTVVATCPSCFKISKDGSKVFFLREGSIQAWSISTGEVMGEVKWLARGHCNSITVDGSRVGVLIEDAQIWWWDFGITGSSPISLPSTSIDRPHLVFVRGSRGQKNRTPCVKNSLTGKEVFQLSGTYVNPYVDHFDGWYMVAGYQSGEVLILDFSHLLPQ